MNWVCDICERNKYSFDIDAPVRSRCYSCEHSEMPWREAVAEEIRNVFLVETAGNSINSDIQNEALVHAIIVRITRPGPPPVSLRVPKSDVALSGQVHPSLPGGKNYEIIDAEIISES